MEAGLLGCYKWTSVAVNCPDNCIDGKDKRPVAVSPLLSAKDAMGQGISVSVSYVK